MIQSHGFEVVKGNSTFLIRRFRKPLLASGRQIPLKVSWWGSQAQLVQDKANQGESFGVLATFKELGNKGASVHLGDARPADAEAERDAWAEHFRLGAREDEVTAELLKFGGTLLWGSVVKVCRAQWLLLTDAAPGSEVVWPSEWCIGLAVPLWKLKGNMKDKNTWKGITLLSVGSKLLARVMATRLGSWFDEHALRVAPVWVSPR